MEKIEHLKTFIFYNAPNWECDAAVAAHLFATKTVENEVSSRNAHATMRISITCILLKSCVIDSQARPEQHFWLIFMMQHFDSGTSIAN